MKLLSNTKYKITKVGNEENILHLGITEVVIVDCNIANNDYQHDLRVLYIFFQNKPIGQLLDISSKNFYKPLIHIFHIFKRGLLFKILNR